MRCQSVDHNGTSADRLLREALRMLDAPERTAPRSARRGERLQAMARRRFTADVENLTSAPDTSPSPPKSGAIIVEFKPRFEAHERRQCNAS